MVKRKCGTCRYFRDAGIACSGWCTHPERGDLHDLVLVRREELACRNSWDQDLWQPTANPVEAHSGAPGPHIPPPHEIEAFTSQSPVPENPTDRVTSISISQTRRNREQYLPPAVTGGQPAAVAETSAKVDARSQLEPIATLPGKQHGVSALEPSFKRAVRAGTGQRLSRTERRGDVAYRADRATGDAAASAQVDSAGSSGRPGPRHRDTPLRSRPEPSSDTSPLPVGEVNRLFSAMRDSGQLHAPDIAPSDMRTPGRSLDEALRASGDTGYSRSAGRRTTPMQQEAPVEPSHDDTQSFVHTDIAGMSSATTADTFTERAVATPAAAPWPIDERSWVRGIPRCCDTCREFQRDSDGRSGRCGSNYAATRGAVVECDQLACRSSVGLWWLPSDDFWLEQSDISHHTRPTPYLDAVLAKKSRGR